MTGKSEGPLKARREAAAQRSLLEIEKESREKAELEARQWEERAKKAVYKAEYAYEVLRSILEELRKGQRVSKPSLTRAWQRLPDVPEEFKRDLFPHDTKLDKELRKDDPNKR